MWMRQRERSPSRWSSLRRCVSGFSRVCRRICLRLCVTGARERPHGARVLGHVRRLTLVRRARCLSRSQACPVKDEFDRKARDYVGELEWVKEVRPESLPASQETALAAVPRSSACGCGRSAFKRTLAADRPRSASHRAAPRPATPLLLHPGDDQDVGVGPGQPLPRAPSGPEGRDPRGGREQLQGAGRFPLSLAGCHARAAAWSATPVSQTRRLACCSPRPLSLRAASASPPSQSTWRTPSP